jgi:4-amino-4-deoxy-L-arabinose transferase-like glycosyltransferase
MPTLSRNTILLSLLLIISFLIRFYRIDTYPALNPDEAALGYNAYSLLLTGRDEHGASWPLHFKSFGDYKPGGYVYLDLPFIALFGLNTLAVRLPNLILSLLSIFFFYRLVLLLSANRSLSLMSAAVLAFSPWHIHFSRGAWESNAALSLILIGSYFFFSYLKKPTLRSLLLFVLLFSLSLSVYHSARLIAPLLVLGYILFNLKPLFKHIPHLLAGLFLGLLISVPILISFLTSGGSARFGGVGLTADPGPRSRSEELLNHHQSSLTITDRILHNYRFEYTLAWASHYLSHFDLNFLFLLGDEVPRSKVPFVGQFLIIGLPLLVVGCFSLAKYSGLSLFIIIWTIAAPLASSLTFQTPSSLRALPLVIPLSLLIALGLYRLWPSFSKLFRLVFIVFFSFNFIFYLDAYFVHYQRRFPFSWNMGTKELVAYLAPNLNRYNHIYITNVYDQPYILYLFFSRYSPSRLQSQIQLTPPDKFGFSTVSTIDNITFHVPPYDQIPPNSLIAAAPTEITAMPPLQTISYQNFPPTFKIYIK